MGRTGAGGLGFNASDGRDGALAVFLGAVAAFFGVDRTAFFGAWTLGVPAGFLAGAAFLVTAAGFFAVALFCGSTERFAEEVTFAFRDEALGRCALLLEDALFFAVVATFFTGAAFFVWWERF